MHAAAADAGAQPACRRFLIVHLLVAAFAALLLEQEDSESECVPSALYGAVTTLQNIA